MGIGKICLLGKVLVIRSYGVWVGAPFVPASPLVFVTPLAAPLVAPLVGCRDDNTEEEDDGDILPFLSHNFDAVSTCGLSQVVARGMARRAA
jgi:hypothetical protein